MRFLALILCWLGLLGLARAQVAPFAALERITMADLLHIPLSDPAVTVKVLGTRREEGLIIEDVIWESLDHEHVPAYVIRPANASGRLPAVIYLHGSNRSRESECAPKFVIGPWTNANGKVTNGLLGAARELARRGYVALALTQRGLDNRRPSTEDQAKDLLLRGRTLLGAEVYEVRQAITYLASRPDVDPHKIAASGLSFGGVNTFYTWLVDLRLAAAAPICGAVGSMDILARTGNRGYHGIYLWIPGLLTKGDEADFAAAMAPRPLMVWAPTEDIAMPREGVDQFVAEVRPAYERAGAAGNFVVYQRPGVHALTPEAFELMVRFFEMHLKH